MYYFFPLISLVRVILSGRKDLIGLFHKSFIFVSHTVLKCSDQQQLHFAKTHYFNIYVVYDTVHNIAHLKHLDSEV